MAKKIPLERLAAELEDILAEYGDSVTEGTAQAVITAAQTAQKELRSTSPKSRTGGKYARSWKVEIERGRLFTTATVYNGKPGLPHLLEFGHVSRNGTGRTFGSVRAYPHIATVEQQTIDSFEKAIVERIQS